MELLLVLLVVAFFAWRIKRDIAWSRDAGVPGAVGIGAVVIGVGGVVVARSLGIPHLVVLAAMLGLLLGFVWIVKRRERESGDL